jgi:hypothetical protein
MQRELVLILGVRLPVIQATDVHTKLEAAPTGWKWVLMRPNATQALVGAVMNVQRIARDTPAILGINTSGDVDHQYQRLIDAYATAGAIVSREEIQPYVMITKEGDLSPTGVGPAMGTSTLTKIRDGKPLLLAAYAYDTRKMPTLEMAHRLFVQHGVSAGIKVLDVNNQITPNKLKEHLAPYEALMVVESFSKDIVPF